MSGNSRGGFGLLEKISRLDNCYAASHVLGVRSKGRCSEKYVVLVNRDAAPELRERSHSDLEMPLRHH